MVSTPRIDCCLSESRAPHTRREKSNLASIFSSRPTNVTYRTLGVGRWRSSGRTGAPALFESGHPLKGDLEPYVEHTYNWAFNTWKDSIWQEFEWNGKKVGTPVFIVNVTQSPNYPGRISEREFRSVWNQAWFSVS